MDVETRLLAAAWPWWEAEAAIARRFFAKASPEDHVFYLRAQLWKELNPVDGYFNGLHRELANLVEAFPEIDRTLDRRDFHFRLTQLADEFNHYVLLADLFEHLVGRKIDPSDTVQLPEEKALGDLRRAYAESGSAVDRAAVGFTEGGGARLFREGAALTGGDLARRTAAAMRVIYDDERGHCAEMAKEAAALVGAPADLERMCAAVEAISAQRVRMRAEMFRGAMTDPEVSGFVARARAAFEAGGVGPETAFAG